VLKSELWFRMTGKIVNDLRSWFIEGKSHEWIHRSAINGICSKHSLGNIGVMAELPQLHTSHFCLVPYLYGALGLRHLGHALEPRLSPCTSLG
jgi:hypothetical protein